jgi:hypothetical protein
MQKKWGRSFGLEKEKRPQFFLTSVVWLDLVILKRAIERYSCIGPGGTKGPSI